MTDVTPPLPRSLLGQQQHLTALTVDSGLVLQACGQPQGPCRQLRPQQGRHLLHLSGAGRTLEILFHHPAAQGVVPRVGGDVNSSRGSLQRAKKISQREGRTAVLPDHNRGNALTNLGQCGRLLQDQAIGMTVGINKTRGQHQTASINDRVTVTGYYLSHSLDTVTFDAHAARVPGASSAVYDHRVDDDGGSPCRAGPKGRQ